MLVLAKVETFPLLCLNKPLALRESHLTGGLENTVSACALLRLQESPLASLQSLLLAALVTEGTGAPDPGQALQAVRVVPCEVVVPERGCSIPDWASDTRHVPQLSLHRLLVLSLPLNEITAEARSCRRPPRLQANP